MPRIITNKEQMLFKVAATRNLQELGAVLHELPDCRLPLEDSVAVFKKIQERNEYFKQARMIVCMTLKERAYYINVYMFYTTYPNKEELRSFARKIQADVEFNLSHEIVDGDLEFMRAKSLDITEFLHRNHYLVDAQYATKVAVGELLGQSMMNAVKKILDRGDKEEIRQLLINLAQDISIVNHRYDHLCAYAIVLQDCCKLAVAKYSVLSDNQMLSNFVDKLRSSRDVPIVKLSRLMFNKAGI